jgi:hypothetical protein
MGRPGRKLKIIRLSLVVILFSLDCFEGFEGKHFKMSYQNICRGEKFLNEQREKASL